MNDTRAMQVPRQQYPVENAMDTLAGALVGLERAVEGLIERIQPALAVQAPQIACDPSCAVPAQHNSQLVVALRAKTNLIERITEALGDVTARVEL